MVGWGGPEALCLPEAPWFPRGAFLWAVWPGSRRPPHQLLKCPWCLLPPDPCWLSRWLRRPPPQAPVAPSVPLEEEAHASPRVISPTSSYAGSPHHPHPPATMTVADLTLLISDWLRPGRLRLQAWNPCGTGVPVTWKSCWPAVSFRSSRPGALQGVCPDDSLTRCRCSNRGTQTRTPVFNLAFCCSL